MGRSPAPPTKGPKKAGQKAGQPAVTDAVGQLGTQIQNAQGADLSGVNQAAQAAGHFDPNIQANTGAMMGTAGQLAGFQPLGGAAGNTLQNIIATGAPVDTSPITQAAQIRAGQGFQDFMGQANEQFGALGLGSSSARTASLGREAGRLQQGIAATGMEADVGAQEAARQRQLGAFSPLLQGSGQQLSGLQSAGGLQGQAAGLGLEGQIAQGSQRLQGILGGGQLGLGAAGTQNAFNLGHMGAGQNYVNSLLPAQNQQMNMAPAGARPYVPPTFNRMSKGAASGGVVPGMGGGVQQGGGRVDYGDYLSNLLFGQQFTRRAPEQFQQMQQVFPSRDRGRGESNDDIEARNRAQRAASLDYARQKELMGMQRGWGLDAARYGQMMEGSRAADLARGLWMSSGGRDPNPFALEDITGVTNAVGIPSAHQGLMQSGKMLGTRTAYTPQAQHGGEVNGPSVPPDVVPIMAQGGELVVPVDLRSRIERSNSTDPLIMELKGLIDKPIEDHAQTGGQTVSKEKKEQFQTRGAAGGPSALDPAALLTGTVAPALANPNLLEIDPEKLEMITNPAGSFVTDPFSKKKLAIDAFLKNYPGLLMPGTPGFMPGAVQFQRDPKSGKMSMMPRIEKKQAGGPIGGVGWDSRYNVTPEQMHQAQFPSLPQPAQPQGGAQMYTNEDLAGSQTPEDPFKELNDRFNMAQARVDMMSALATRAPAASRAKMSGLIEQATSERDKVSLEKQLVQQQLQRAMQQQMQFLQSSALQSQRDEAAEDRLNVREENLAARARAEADERAKREAAAARERDMNKVYLEAGQTDAGFNPAKAQEASTQFRLSQTPGGRAIQSSVAGHDVRERGRMPAVTAEDMQAAQQLEMFLSSPMSPAEAQTSGGALRNLNPQMLSVIIPQVELLQNQIGAPALMRDFPRLAKLLMDSQGSFSGTPTPIQ